MWVKRCHVYHPPVITILRGGMGKPFLGLWHCVTHIIPKLVGGAMCQSLKNDGVRQWVLDDIPFL